MENVKDVYNDDFKMRIFTEKEAKEYAEFVDNLYKKVSTVNKEKYEEVKEAFLNLMSDSECYCDKVIIGKTMCWYCEYKNLRKNLIQETVFKEITK